MIEAYLATTTTVTENGQLYVKQKYKDQSHQSMASSIKLQNHEYSSSPDRVTKASIAADKSQELRVPY